MGLKRSDLPAILLLAACCLRPRPAGEPLPRISPERILGHVKFLAGEGLQGRRAGTAGEREAAVYVARELEIAGVPAPPGGQRFQAVPLPKDGSPAAASAPPDEKPPESVNVLGWIEGARDDLKDRVIVLGAHLDHLGPLPSGLHLGAEDNASGVAVLLEIAAALKNNAAGLGRSVLVAFFGAEEAGQLGSERALRSGPVEGHRIACMINVDMIGRPLADQKALGPLKKIFGIDDRNGIGVTGATRYPFFAEVIETASREAGLQVFGTRNIPLLTALVENLAKNRSDHAPFERAGIPNVFFGSGECDDYHQPTDTVEKLVPELMARRARAIYGTVAALSAAADQKMPPRLNASPPPGGIKVDTAKLVHGDLTVLFRDNSSSPGMLSGVDSLFHSSAPDFDAFDPDSRGASAGLNFEHIISGKRHPSNRFTPRNGKSDLYRLEGGRSVMLVRMREDEPWDVSSTIQYTVTAPHAIDMEFRCVPHDPSRFGDRGHAIFFFADYLNDVLEVPLRFLGIEAPGAEEKWISAEAPSGPPHWNRGGTYRHAGARDLEIDADHDFPLNSWSYDYPRFTRPFYYGRAQRDLVFLLMFDRAWRPEDEIRFSIFKFKLPAQPRPAWDFQYVIHRVEPGKRYGFRARLVWKKWISPEDCLKEYENWAASLKES
jgi:hypothetical protein